MKKTNKENPLTFFRKANESRQKVVKNSLTKAQNGMQVYQGPISRQGQWRVDSAERNRNRYPISTDKTIRDISQSDKNPKNSRKIEKHKDYIDLKRDTEKARNKDYRNLPKTDAEKKENRQMAIIAGITEAIAAPFIGKFVAKNWNLEKKKGGAVKRKK